MTTQLELSPSHLAAAHEVLSTAVEYGIGYWCLINAYDWYIHPDTGIFVEPTAGWELRGRLTDHTDFAGEPQFIVSADILMATMLDIIHGTHVHVGAKEVPNNYMKRLAASWWVTPEDFECDVNDADTLFQYAALGKIVYG